MKWFKKLEPVLSQEEVVALNQSLAVLNRTLHKVNNELSDMRRDFRIAFSLRDMEDKQEAKVDKDV